MLEAVRRNNLHDIVAIVNSSDLTLLSTINAADAHGRTPLHIAIKKRRLDIVKILITAGANIKAKDKNGKTPLDIAIAINDGLIEKFLQQKAQESDSECSKNTPNAPSKYEVTFNRLQIPNNEQKSVEITAENLPTIPSKPWWLCC